MRRLIQPPPGSPPLTRLAAFALDVCGLAPERPLDAAAEAARVRRVAERLANAYAPRH